MKKIILFVLSVTIVSFVNAQPGKTAPVAKAPAPVLKTLNDSVSYAVGISVANFYKQQGVKKLNTTLISKAVNDILAGKKPLMDDAAANACMNNYMTQLMAEKSKPTIDAGQKFLAQNKLRSGVKTTSTGLQYEVITEGTGEKPVATDSVTCNYRGTFIDGRGFDSSYNHGPVTFSLGMVIRGWTEGLQLMPVGSKYRLYVPYQLGYGPSDYMSIPGGSAMIFDIELLAVKKGR